MTNGHTTITLGGEEVRLRAVTSHALVLDLIACAESNRRRAMVAALGLAWMGAGTPGATDPIRRYTLKACGFDVLEYGGLVYDELLSRGHTMQSVFAAASEAWDHCLALLIDSAEVEDFSSAQEGAST